LVLGLAAALEVDFEVVLLARFFAGTAGTEPVLLLAVPALLTALVDVFADAGTGAARAGMIARRAMKAVESIILTLD